MIANLTSGGDFGGALDYLMNPKKEQQGREQEREQSREQERQQGQQREAEHTGPVEAKTREQTRSRDDAKRDEQKWEVRQEKPPQIQEREQRPEHVRDLADEYEPGQRHRVIGGNMSGQTPRELEREFNLIWELRPNVEKPVHHASLSAGANDRLTVAQWQEIADFYVEKMGFQNSPHVVIQHRWSEKDHIHILASRVDFNGQVVSEWKSKGRAEIVMREVEEKYDLERLPMSKDVLRAAPTRGEKEVFERTGQLSVKLSLQGHVEQALRGGPTATEFIERLQRVGVGVIPYVQETGRVSGITFRQGDELMKGSDLGRGFSWGGLQKRGLDYDQERDRTAIEAAKERAETAREPEPSVAQAAVELEHSFADAPRDLTRSAGQYFLDQANPSKQIEVDFRQLEHLGRAVAEGSRAVKDLQTGQDNMERLRQAAGLETGGKDAVERLHEAAGLEPVKDRPDVLERLNNAAGVERPDPSPDPLHSPDKARENTPGAPVPFERPIERGVEREAVERTIERGIELLL